MLFHLCIVKSLKSFFETHHEILSGGNTLPVIRIFAPLLKGLV